MDQNAVLQTVGNDDNATAFNNTIDKINEVDKLPLKSIVTTLSNGRRDSKNELSHDIQQQQSDEQQTLAASIVNQTAATSTADSDVQDEIDGHNTDYSSSSSCSTEYGALVINEGSAESNDTNTNTLDAKTNLSQAIAAVKQQTILNSIAEECSSTIEENENEAETETVAITATTIASTTTTTTTTTPTTTTTTTTTTTPTKTTTPTTSNECTMTSNDNGSPLAAPISPDDIIELANLIDASKSPVSVAMPLINGDHLNSCSSASEAIETVAEGNIDDEQHKQQQEQQVTMKRKLSCDSGTEEVAEKRAKESCDDRVSIDMENSIDSLDNDVHRLDYVLRESNEVMCSKENVDALASICETIGTTVEKSVTIDAVDETTTEIDHVQILATVNRTESYETTDDSALFVSTNAEDTAEHTAEHTAENTAEHTAESEPVAVRTDEMETEETEKTAEFRDSTGTAESTAVITELVEANKSTEWPVIETSQLEVAPEARSLKTQELADASEALIQPDSNLTVGEVNLTLPDEMEFETHTELASITTTKPLATVSVEPQQTIFSEANSQVSPFTFTEMLPITTAEATQHPTLPEVIRTIHSDLSIPLHTDNESPLLSKAIPVISENATTTRTATAMQEEPMLSIPVSSDISTVFRTNETLNSLSYLNGYTNVNRSINNTIESEYSPLPPSLNSIKDRTEMKHFLKHQLMFGTISENYFNEYAQCLGLDAAPKFKCFKCDANQFQSLTELKTHQLVCLRSLDNNNVDNHRIQQHELDQEPKTIIRTVSTDLRMMFGSHNQQQHHELEQSNFYQTIGGSINDALKPLSTANHSSHAESKLHNRIRPQLFLCLACRTYWEKWHLFYHIREVHKKFICLFCLGIFATAERLVNHLESKHISKPNIYEHKDGLMNSLKDQCYLMCCVCEHIFSENDDFTGHSCENYMAPCSHCSLKFIHKPNCSFAIKNKLMVKKTAPIATKPMMATLEQHRQQQMRTKHKNMDDSRRTPKNGELVPAPIFNANHLPHYEEKSDAIEMERIETLTATAIQNNEPPLLAHSNNNNNAYHPNELPAKEQNNPISESSDDDASSEAADSSSDDSDSNVDHSNSESEQSPVKEAEKCNDIGGEQRVETLKLKLSNIRNPIYTDTDDDSNSNDESGQNEYNDSRPESDRNKSNYMNENIAFQITAGNEDIGTDSSNRDHNAPLLVPKLKLKIVKDFQPPAESDESSSTESDDDANDDEANNGDFDETNSNEIATNNSTDHTLNVTGDSENLCASSPIMDSDCFQSANTIPIMPMENQPIENELMEPMEPMEPTEPTEPMESMEPEEPIENQSMAPMAEVPPKEMASMEIDQSVPMDIDDELQYHPSSSDAQLESSPKINVFSNWKEPEPPTDTNDEIQLNFEPSSGTPPKTPVSPSRESMQQELSETAPELNDQAESAEVCDTPEEKPIEVIDYRPIIDLLLDQPLDKMPVKQFIRKCLSASFPICLYCNYARKIAVDGTSLAQHLVINHRFSATVDSITAEELLPSTIEQRLKCSVDELNQSYFNLESYDYKCDEPQPQPFIKSFECLQCRFQSLVYKDLYLHNRKMHLRAALICHMCKSNFFSYSELLCHMCPGETFKLIPINLKFRCVLCNLEDIPSAFRLMVHLRKKHFACDVCLEECSDQSKLSCHVWKHKLHHLCYRCNITYRNKADITKHLFWKHGTESVLCKRCLEKKWPHVYHFCVPPTKFTCENCGLIFSRAVALKVHKRLHAADGIAYPCTEDGCEKRFISRKLLLKHVNRHNQPIEVPIEIEPSVNSDLDVQVTKSPIELRDETIKVEVNEGKIDVADANQKSGDKNNEEEKPSEAVEEKNAIAPAANDNDGNLTVDLQSKQKEKRQKKKKITDLLGDLPTLNLSESDSSDDSENESSITNSALMADHSMQSFSSTINATYGEACIEIPTTIDDDEDIKSTAPIVDIWENFKSYQASQMHDKMEDTDDDGLLCETPTIMHVNQSDHDYCMMYKPLKKDARPVLAHSTSVPFVQVGDKGDINIVYIDVEPEQPVDEKEIITEETKDIKELEAEKKMKENLSGSDSSSSSSDSDSSSCSNCDSNCSCSSSSSGSSSSSSDSDSDSSSKSKESPKKNLKSKKVRDQERAALTNRHDPDGIEMSPKKEASPIRDRLKSETDVVDVDVESTDIKPPVVNIDPDTIINESDLETAESDTDEDFYDDHPQKMANQMLAEKRRELLFNAQIHPFNMSEIVENSRPSTPSLPEEAAREERIKIKKRKKVRKNSRNLPATEKVHIPVETPQIILPGLVTAAPAICEAPPSFGVNLKPSAFTPNVVNSFTPNALPPANTPTSGQPTTFADTRKHLISESRLSTSSCSDADTSLKRSKRRRIPNKFYGYTSDEEAASLMMNPATMINSLNPFKPIPPPILTWSKEDLPDPEPAKIVQTPPIKTIIRLPSLNNVSTPKSRKTPTTLTKGKPKGRVIKKTPNTPKKSLGSQKQLLKRKLNQTPIQPLIPPLIIRTNSAVKPPPTPPVGFHPASFFSKGKVAFQKTGQQQSYPAVHMFGASLPEGDAQPSRKIENLPGGSFRFRGGDHPLINEIPTPGNLPGGGPQNDSDNSSNDSESDSDSSDDDASSAAPALQPYATPINAPIFSGNLPAPSTVPRDPFMPPLRLGSLVTAREPLLATHLSHTSSQVSPSGYMHPDRRIASISSPSVPLHAPKSAMHANATMQPPRFPINTQPASHPAREGESVYCYCRCPYDGVSEMIGCDGSNCPIEWFHFECVNIVVPPSPSDKWYCPQCKPKYDDGDASANDAAAAKLPIVARNFMNNLEPHVQPSANNTFQQHLSLEPGAQSMLASSCVTPSVT